MLASPAMTQDNAKTPSEDERARARAEFNYEIGKALRDYDEGRVVDLATAFKAARTEFDKAKSKRAA